MQLARGAGDALTDSDYPTRCPSVCSAGALSLAGLLDYGVQNQEGLGVWGKAKSLPFTFHGASLWAIRMG